MEAPTPFTRHTQETASERVRPALVAAERRFGYLPSPLALMAESPLLVESFGRLSALWEQSSLGKLEREAVVLTIARENGCDYCVAMHTPLVQSAGADEALVAALRSGTPVEDARLGALVRFTRAVLAHRGQVPPVTLDAFLAEGFSRQQALEVVVGVGAYTLSTYANRLTGAPLDAALEPFRWTP